ncbi:MAG: hypothetical protein WBE72_18420 [Terracidiphilus sp.]
MKDRQQGYAIFFNFVCDEEGSASENDLPRAFNSAQASGQRKRRDPFTGGFQATGNTIAQGRLLPHEFPQIQ